MSGEDFLSLSHVLKIAFVRNRVKGRGFNDLHSLALLLHFLLQVTNGVIKGIACSADNNGSSFNGTSDNITRNNLPLIIKALPVLRFRTTFHTVIQVQKVGCFGKTYLPCVNGTAHDSRKTGLMQKVDNLRVRIGLYQLAFRENVIEVVITGRLQIFQTAQVERLNQVITCTFHQRRTVRVFSRQHIGEVDTKLGLTCTFRHGNGEEVQFSIQNFLVCVHIPLEVMAAGLVELLIQWLAILNGLQIIIKEMRCAEQQRTEQQIVKPLCGSEVRTFNGRPQRPADIYPHVMVPLMGNRKIYLLILPAEVKEVIIWFNLHRVSMNSFLNTLFQFQIIHPLTSQ